MATSGIPIDIPLEHISNALKKNRGIVTRASKDLKIAPKTLYNFVNTYPEIKQLLDDLRHDYETEMLDDAENVLKYATQQDVLEKDLSSALRSAMYTLNTKGAKRGYLPAEVAAAQEESRSKADALRKNIAEEKGFIEYLANKDNYLVWLKEQREGRNASQNAVEPDPEGSDKSQSDGQADAYCP